MREIITEFEFNEQYKFNLKLYEHKSIKKSLMDENTLVIMDAGQLNEKSLLPIKNILTDILKNRGYKLCKLLSLNYFWNDESRSYIVLLGQKQAKNVT